MSTPKDKPVRWTLRTAAAEFDVSRETLKGRLIRAGISPAADDRYSTKQILAALVGDFDGQKLRKLTAEADLAELARGEMDGKLLPASVVEAVWQDALGKMKDVIMATPMPDESRRQIMKSMQTIPLSEYSAPQAGPGDADTAD